MKKNFIRFSPSILLSIFLCAILYNYIFVEINNPDYSHSETKFAEDFSIHGFENIKKGMCKKEVEKIIGKPFYFEQKVISSIQPKNSYISVYASDGKSIWGDSRWESFDIYFNTENIVIGKSRKWWDD